jgi:hypothetical protein
VVYETVLERREDGEEPYRVLTAAVGAASGNLRRAIEESTGKVLKALEPRKLTLRQRIRGRL